MFRVLSQCYCCKWAITCTSHCSDIVTSGFFPTILSSPTSIYSKSHAMLTESTSWEFESSILDIPKSPSLTSPDFVRKIFKALMSLKKED